MKQIITRASNFPLRPSPRTREAFTRIAPLSVAVINGAYVRRNCHSRSLGNVSKQSRRRRLCHRSWECFWGTSEEGGR